jgi:hypothetical protein
MKIEEQIKDRFHQLSGTPTIHRQHTDFGEHVQVDSFEWSRWSTQVLNLFDTIFGQKSPYFINFKKICEKFSYREYEMEQAKGVFEAAQYDYANGYIYNM